MATDDEEEDEEEEEGDEYPEGEEPEGDDDDDEPAVFIVEQYAQRVLDFSSQYGSDSSYSYTASNVLGVPSKFPAYGDNPETFVLSRYGQWSRKSPSGRVYGRRYCARPQDCCESSDDFVDLKFQHSVFAHQLYIYETFNPGAVHQIWGGDCRGRWACLFVSRVPPSPVGHQPRAYSPPLKSAGFPINMIRIIFSHSHLGYHSEIDAVALLGTVSRPTSEESSVCGAEPMPVPIDVGPILDMVLELKIGATSSLAEMMALLDTDLASIGQSLVPREAEAEPKVIGFEFLPRETLVYLFSFLNVISLGRCAQVCLLFNRVASDPQLYTRLCFKSIFHAVGDPCLQALARKCQFLSHLDLSWSGNYGTLSPSVLGQFLSACGSTLAFLRLNNCHSVTREVMETMGHACRAQLCDLSLSNCHLLQPNHFDPLQKLTGLRSLNLYRTKIGQKQLFAAIGANRGLQHLDVSACCNVNGDDLCKVLKQSVPELVSLELFRVNGVTSRGVADLSALTKLQEIDLGWCCSVDASTGCIVRLAQNCPDLAKLFLTAHRQTSDRDLAALSKLDKLQQLDVMGTRNVTVAGVRALLESSADGGLCLLDIGYCEQLEESADHLTSLVRAFPQCHIVTSYF